MTGQLPNGWCDVELAEVVEILDHQRVPVNNAERAQRLAHATTTYPYYGATGQVGYIDDYLFEGESVLLGEDGAPFLDPYRAKAYLASGKYWVNNHAHILRGTGSIANRFLSHQLNTLDYRPHVSGTTRLKLTQASLKELPIKLPPLAEQRRIVEKIEVLFAELNKGEESLREVQKLLVRYRQSVLKAAVTGQLTADWRAENAHRFEHGRDLLNRILQVRRDTWSRRGKYKEPEAPTELHPIDLPEGWTWATIDQVSSMVDYGTSAKCTADREGVPVLRMGNIVDGALDLSDLKFLPSGHPHFPALLLEPGDLLFNRTNSAELVGKSAVFSGELPYCSFASYLIRARTIEVEPSFVSTFINSVFGRDWIRRVVSQQVGQANVNGSKLKALAIPLPPRDEQAVLVERMGEHLSKLEDLENYCREELARSTALRQSILKDAFAGRLVPQNPADEPAAELLARIRAERATEAPTPRRKAARPSA